MLAINRYVLLYCAVLLLAKGSARPLNSEQANVDLLVNLIDQLIATKAAKMEKGFELEKMVAKSRRGSKSVPSYAMAHLIKSPMSSMFG